jgi:DNA repair protein RadA/Sms
MAKARTLHRCTDCGRSEPKWLGQCPDCGSWGTFVEEAAGPRPDAPAPRGRVAASPPARPARPIREVPFDERDRAMTGIGELDRVLGGGLVPGSVVLVGGEPGAGKSTLLLQAAQTLAAGEPGRPERTVLYVSAEESPGQVRLRAERLGALDERLLLASETDLGAVLGLVDAHAPDVLILDSIQTVRHPEVSGLAGGPAQVRECAAALVAAAKERDLATILVGHVTKDGQLAGPRVLEHLVDAVCELSGDRHHALRLLRAVKNRFGAVGEVGCFEMGDAGMRSILDVGRLFVGETPPGTAGIARTMAMEGHRPLVCEVQALVAHSHLTNPRRVASGVDGQRLSLLLAVLERRAGVRLAESDVYASSVGGLRLVEPAVDLALCLAVASARSDRGVAPGLVALGEVGLAGELRLVAQTERRLAEAARLGLGRALLPHAYDGADHGLTLLRARDVRTALAMALEDGGPARP